VVDTLGAGDAFIARLLLGLIQDEPTAELVTAATAYATASCASFGAFGHATPLSPPLGAPTGAPMPLRTSPSQHDPDRLDVS
jgi:hypothetical protein